MDSLLKATAEAAGSTIATADFLLSPAFLWVAANAIIIWLLSSSRRGRSRTNDDDDDATSSSSASRHDGEVAVRDAVDSLYTSSSKYEAFSDAASPRRALDAPASTRRLPREARAAARRADRPRVRNKPAVQDARSPRSVFAAEPREPDKEIIRREETPVPAATEPRPGGDGLEDEEDVSMDSLWQSIVQQGAARPVVVQKSESWSNGEMPQLQRMAETAAATRREMRKSVSAVNKAAAPQPSVPSAVRQLGWRTRDVLVSIAPDELLRRAESFIRRQREHLNLQRQESEQRQLLLQRRLHASSALVRV